MEYVKLHGIMAHVTFARHVPGSCGSLHKSYMPSTYMIQVGW